VLNGQKCRSSTSGTGPSALSEQDPRFLL
jgi:hypothetical protein